jgi:RibD C-terminal domain
VIFAAVDGGLAAALGGAGTVDSSRRPGDMAELVDAFEKSPTSVAAREDTVAGPASVKADGRAAVVGSAGATAKTPSVASEKIAPASRDAVPGTVMDLDRSAASAPPANWSVRTPVAVVAAPEASVGAAEAAPGVSPPTVAAAGDVRGVEPNSDDATWAGAALSGAIPVSPVADPVVANAPGPTAASEPKVTSEAKGSSEAKTTSGGRAKGASAPTYEAFAARAALIAYANIGDTVLIPRSPANVTPGSSTGTTAGLPAGASVGALAGAAAATKGGAAAATKDAAAAATKDAAAQAPGANAPAAPSAPSPAPVSAAAVSAGPMSAGPVSAAPVSAGPMSAGPVSAGPPSAGPVSAAPVGAGSVSAGPSIAARVSAGPTGSAAGAAVARGAVPAKAPGKGDSLAAFQERRAALVAKGVRIEEVPSDEGFLDLFAVLKKLGEMEVNEVLVEAGPTLAGQLVTTFLVDELLLYVAPKLLGPQGRPLVNLPELQSLQDAWGFSLFDAKRFGDDLRLRMRPK